MENPTTPQQAHDALETIDKALQVAGVAETLSAQGAQITTAEVEAAIAASEVDPPALTPSALHAAEATAFGANAAPSQPSEVISFPPTQSGAMVARPGVETQSDGSYTPASLPALHAADAALFASSAPALVKDALNTSQVLGAIAPDAAGTAATVDAPAPSPDSPNTVAPAAPVPAAVDVQAAPAQAGQSALAPVESAAATGATAQPAPSGPQAPAADEVSAQPASPDPGTTGAAAAQAPPEDQKLETFVLGGTTLEERVASLESAFELVRKVMLHHGIRGPQA